MLLLKSLHCIKTVRYLTDPVIAQYQFWLLSQKFLSVTCTKLFTTFFPNTTCCWIRNLVSVGLVRASLLSPILVDLKKAFDLVDHDTLLNKLRIYGCSHSTIVWFRSYLSGRSQKTQFRNTLSEALPVSVGVPQGSILGPQKKANPGKPA